MLTKSFQKLVGRDATFCFKTTRYLCYDLCLMRFAKNHSLRALFLILFPNTIMGLVLSTSGLSEGRNRPESSGFGQQEESSVSPGQEQRQPTHIGSDSTKTSRACLGGSFAPTLKSVPRTKWLPTIPVYVECFGYWRIVLERGMFPLRPFKPPTFFIRR